MSMRILLTNDDGLGAEGLVMMARALSADHEVFVAAPDRECSGASQRITLRKPFDARRMPFPAEVGGCWEICGSPADCVKAGILHLVPGGVGIVVSGVNPGLNVGVDVFYSGTVAAAREALIRNTGALAVSAQVPRPDFDLAVAVAKDLVLGIEGVPLPPGVMLNVNVPNTARERGSRIRLTRQGGNLFADECTASNEAQDGAVTLAFSSRIRASGQAGGSDCRAVVDGEISVSPLGIDLNCAGGMEAAARLVAQVRLPQ